MGLVYLPINWGDQEKPYESMCGRIQTALHCIRSPLHSPSSDLPRCLRHPTSLFGESSLPAAATNGRAHGAHEEEET